MSATKSAEEQPAQDAIHGEMCALADHAMQKIKLAGRDVDVQQREDSRHDAGGVAVAEGLTREHGDGANPQDGGSPIPEQRLLEGRPRWEVALRFAEGRQ